MAQKGSGCAAALFIFLAYGLVQVYPYTYHYGFGKCYSTVRMLNYNWLHERKRCEIVSYATAHLEEQIFPQAMQVGSDAGCLWPAAKPFRCSETGARPGAVDNQS